MRKVLFMLIVLLLLSTTVFAASRIQIRRDVNSSWDTADPILAQGEMGYITDTGQLKIGDGSTNWNSLPFYSTIGSMFWSSIVNFPAACAAGEAITGLDIVPTCSSFLTDIVGLNISDLTNDSNYQTYTDVQNYAYPLTGNPSGFITSYLDTNFETAGYDFDDYLLVSNYIDTNYETAGYTIEALLLDTNYETAGYTIEQLLLDTNFETNGLSIQDINNLWLVNGSAIYYNKGDVGIGTDSPNYKLEIAGGDIALDNYQYLRAKDTSGTSRTMFTFDNTNSALYGGGATENYYFRDAFAAPHVSFLADGNVQISDGGTRYTNLTHKTNSNFKIETSVGGIEFYNGDIFNSFFKGDGDTYHYGSEFVTDNLMVGTTNEDGSRIVTNQDNAQKGLFMTTTDTDTATYIRLDDESSNSVMLLQKDADDDFQLKGYANAALTVQISADDDTYFNGGNVGIGENFPASKLHIGSADSSATGIRVYNTGNDFTSFYYNGANATDDFLITRTGTGGAEISFEDDGDIVLANGSNGNLGIGTTPKSNTIIHIKDNTQYTNMLIENTSSTANYETLVSLNSTSSTGDSSVRFANNETYEWTMGLDAGDSDKFKIQNGSLLSIGTNAFTIDQSNNVGIGTTSPTTKLHVEGDLNVTEDLYVDNNVFVKNEVWAYRFRMYDGFHAFGGFQDESTQLNLAIQNQWYPVTNIDNNLWNGTETYGIQLVDDNIFFENSADYTGSLSITFSGVTGKDLQFRVYNLTQAKQQGYYIGATTTGTTNFTNVSIPLYLEDIDAGDLLRIEARTTSVSGASPYLRSAIFWLSYLHE